jgi:hypothetical protein
MRLKTMLIHMGSKPLIALFALSSMAASALPQAAQPSFEVASVRPSQNQVGPDYNNQITISLTGFTGRNVTLKRLIAEAWHCQRNQAPKATRFPSCSAACLPSGFN